MTPLESYVACHTDADVASSPIQYRLTSGTHSENLFIYLFFLSFPFFFLSLFSLLFFHRLSLVPLKVVVEAVEANIRGEGGRTMRRSKKGWRTVEPRGEDGRRGRR